MQIPALPSVECAILHDQFNPLDGKLVFHAIQTIAKEINFILDPMDVQLMPGSDQYNVYVFAGGHRILVSQSQEPLGAAGFRNALTTPYTGMILPDAHDIVQRHTSNTFVTISKGVFDTPADLKAKLGGELAQLDSFLALEDADKARDFCRLLVNALIRNNPATAIHWCVSDNLVSQEFYEQANKSDMNLLNLRPFLSSSAGRMGDGLPLGMVLNGSQWVVGKMVSFEEAPVPFSWMMEVALGFIKMCQLRGSIIPHNESFGVEEENWTVGVVHEPAREGAEWEHVKLVVVDAPEFGIHGDASAKRTFKYESSEDIRKRAEEERKEIRAANDVAMNEDNILNPDDDMDRAILEKLQKQNQKETEPVPEEVKPAAPLEPWEGKQRENNLESLRELARLGGSRGGQDPDSPQKGSGSVIKKVSGLFRRK